MNMFSGEQTIRIHATPTRNNRDDKEPIYRGQKWDGRKSWVMTRSGPPLGDCYPLSVRFFSVADEKVAFGVCGIRVGFVKALRELVYVDWKSMSDCLPGPKGDMFTQNSCMEPGRTAWSAKFHPWVYPTRVYE